MVTHTAVIPVSERAGIEQKRSPLLLLSLIHISQPSKITKDDHVVISAHLRLLGEVFASEPLEAAVGVTGDIDHAACLL